MCQIVYVIKIFLLNYFLCDLQKLYNRMAAAEMAERAAKSSSNKLVRNDEEEVKPAAEIKVAASSLTLPLFSFVSAYSNAQNNGSTQQDTLVNGIEWAPSSFF